MTIITSNIARMQLYMRLHLTQQALGVTVCAKSGWVAQRNSLNTGFFPLLLFAIRAGLLTDWLFQTVCRFDNRHIHVQKPEYRWLYNTFSAQW